MQLALDAEKSSADAAAIRHDRERRTRRINEMLCYRIYKRNQILPLKQQALGTSYNAGSDSMNMAVRITLLFTHLLSSQQTSILNARICCRVKRSSFRRFLKYFLVLVSPFSG